MKCGGLTFCRREKTRTPRKRISLVEEEIQLVDSMGNRSIFSRFVDFVFSIPVAYANTMNRHLTVRLSKHCTGREYLRTRRVERFEREEKGAACLCSIRHQFATARATIASPNDLSFAQAVW